MRKLLLLFICISIMLTGCRSIGRIVEQNGIEKAEAEHDKLTEKTLQEESITAEDFFADIPEHVNMTLTKGDYKVEIDAPVIIGTDKLYTGRLKHTQTDIEKLKKALYGADAEKLVLYDHPEDFEGQTVYLLPDENDTLRTFIEDGAQFMKTDDGQNTVAFLSVDNADSYVYFNDYYKDELTRGMAGFYPVNALPGCTITVEEAEKKVDEFLEALGEDTETWYKLKRACGPYLEEYVGPPLKTGSDTYYQFVLFKKAWGIPVIGNEYYTNRICVSEKGIVCMAGNYTFSEVYEEKEIESLLPLEEALKLFEDELDLIGMRVQDTERLVDKRYAERKIVEIRLEYYMNKGNEFIPTWYLVEESDTKWKDEDIGTSFYPNSFNIRINALNGDYIQELAVY